MRAALVKSYIDFVCFDLPNSMDGRAEMIL